MRIGATGMPMPKASPHIDYFFPVREHQIWFTRECRFVETKAVTHLVDEASNDQLRLGILAADLAHVL